jgi:hypothetical protein
MPLKLLQMAPNLMLAMGRFLQHSLVLANRRSPFPIALLQQTNSSEYYFVFFIHISYHMSNRAHTARWCAESHRPFKIVKDREFGVLMKAARPGTNIPSPMTVSRDIKTAFDSSRERIDRILKVRPYEGFYYYLSFESLSRTGTPWLFTLRHRCVDFPKSSSVHCLDGIPAPRGTHLGILAGCC